MMKRPDVLEDARLITRSKMRRMYVPLTLEPMSESTQWLRWYERIWSGSLYCLVRNAEAKEYQVRRAEL
jgi:hypothetical protein